MSREKISDGNDPKRIEEKSLTGSSYTFQHEEMPMKEVDVSDDDD